MGKVLNELAKLIEDKKRELEELQGKLDRADLNHPAMQVHIAQDILVASAQLETLESFHKLMSGENV